MSARCEGGEKPVSFRENVLCGGKQKTTSLVGSASVIQITSLLPLKLCTMSSLSTQALRATAVLSAVLWFKVCATNIGLGGAKNNAGTRPAEDTYQKNAADATEEDKTNLDRAQRIVNNDLENIPYTMILAWGSVYCIGQLQMKYGLKVSSYSADGHALAHIVFYTIFVISRVAHSIVYIKGLSTPRSIVWLFGALCSFGIAINGAIASFK